MDGNSPFFRLLIVYALDLQRKRPSAWNAIRLKRLDKGCVDVITVVIAGVRPDVICEALRLSGHHND
jgi:hypothetical protein